MRSTIVLYCMMAVYCILMVRVLMLGFENYELKKQISSCDGMIQQAMFDSAARHE